MEVVPVHLSDPWIALSIDESTKQILGFIPILAFIALLITAEWRQSRKFPVKLLPSTDRENGREF